MGEGGAGSDVASIKTHGTFDGDDYVALAPSRRMSVVLAWFETRAKSALLTMRTTGGAENDHALSLPRGALVPAALDAGRARAGLRIENAAVPAAGVRQGIPRAQSARHHSPDDRRRNQDDGVLRHLSLSRYKIRTDAADRWRRRAGLWRIPELDVFQRCDADLSANAGAALQPARARGTAQSAGGRRLRQMVPRPAAGCRSRHRQGRDVVRRSVHRGRYRHRLRAAARRKHRAIKGFRAQRRRLLAALAGARWI